MITYYKCEEVKPTWTFIVWKNEKLLFLFISLFNFFLKSMIELLISNSEDL